MANGVAPLPVICDDCDRLWLTHGFFGIEGPGSIRAVMSDNTVAPCPHCGGTGHIVDGTYEISRNSVRILTGLPAPVRVRVREEIERARAEEASQAAVAERIENLATRIDESTEATVEATEKVSNEIRILAGEIRKMSRADWKYWLLFAATFLAEQVPPWYGQPTPTPPPVPATSTTTVTPSSAPNADDEIDRIVRGVVERMQETAKEQPSPTIDKVGRNEQCPCGSGIKYKRCHGG